MPERTAIGRPFVPGQSGNPNGRPAGVTQLIRKKAGPNYEKLIVALFTMALGTAKQREKLFGESVPVSARDRRECIRELLDRGIGRPRIVEDDDLPPLAQTTGDGGPQIIFNIPRPPEEMAGRTTVIGVVQMHTAEPKR